MMKLSTIILTIAVVFLAFLAVPANAFEIGAKAYYWYPSISGDVRLDSGSVIGSKIDFKDDLGISNQGIPSGEIFAGIGKHHLSLMYTSLGYKDTTVLARNLTYNGRVYTAGSSVDSSLKASMIDLEYQYDLLDLKNILAGFSVGLIGKIKYLDGEVKLTSPSLGFDEKESNRGPIPMVGAAVNAGILANILKARVKATGIAYSSSYLYDVLADVSFTPFPFFELSGGYRYLKAKVEKNDLTANACFAGPYVSLGISF